jgi:nucleotide-binding universal stress UspA family protein
MFKLKRILFPVDFSERSEKAAFYVDALATRFDADLILLHVVQPPTYNTSLGDARGSHWESFGHVFSDHRLRIQHLTEHGEVASKIVECAGNLDADLIMMPTHGLGAYRRLIIGSNTAKVLHDSARPVWTSAHIQDTRAPAKVACDHVVCAVDLRPSSAGALQWAARFAEACHARLTLVHVTTNSPAARRALDALQKEVGSNAAVRIESGEPAEVVALVTQDLKADLLVIGRASPSEFLGRLDMTEYSIIRQSPCPVISV